MNCPSPGRNVREANRNVTMIGAMNTLCVCVWGGGLLVYYEVKTSIEQK